MANTVAEPFETSGTLRFSIGKVLAVSFGILARNFIPFMAVAIVLAIPNILVGWWANRIQLNPEGGIVAGHYWVRIVSVVVGTVIAALTQSALTFGTLQALRGQKAKIGEFLSGGLSATPKVVAAAIIWTITVGVGSALFLVPGIILLVMFWVYVPAIVVERAGIIGSLGRSRVLTKGHRWSIFGLFFVVGLIFFGLEFFIIKEIGVSGIIAAASNVWLAWIMGAISIIVTAYAAVLTSVGYYYLRAEKEGIAIDEIATVFD
jgi:MFS family permease